MAAIEDDHLATAEDIRITLNLCGEGEESGAIDINLLDADLLTRRLETVLSGGRCIQADARILPIADGCADRVVGNMLPYEVSWFQDLAREALRVLKAGHRCFFWASTPGAAGLTHDLEAVGFVDVHIEGPYATGKKP